jgi:Domain of unknown function (DUF222)/HNH endonuclease
MFSAELAEVRDRCRSMATVTRAACTDDDLCQAAVMVASARAALDALELHVLAQLEARQVCDREFGLSTASWVADQAHVPRGGVATRVKVGTRLRSHLSQVDAALSRGRISFDHARTLADAANPRILDRVAEHQTELLEPAEHLSFTLWRRLVTELTTLWDEDGGYDPDRDLTRNHLHLNPVGDTTALSGELVGEVALTVTQVLDAETDKLWRRYQHDHERCPDLELPSRSTLRALALADICRRASGTEPGRAPGVEVTLVAQVVASTATTTPARPETMPTCTLRMPDGSWLDLERYQHLLCDPIFRPLLVDGRLVPLAMGRAVRLATPAQRRALAVRDRGCVFPGCDRPPGWCDAHHIVAYDAGGATDLLNLVLLCRHHHGVTHRRGWSLQVDGDGTPTWTTPSGRVLAGDRAGAWTVAA